MFWLIFISLGFAQQEDREIRYQKSTEIDFDAIDITGEMVKPQGALIQDRSRTTFNPLIELRTDWNQEMSQSVSTIK